MTFTEQAWAAAAPVRSAIDELPFLQQLEAGTLPREVFHHYLAQDAHYLAVYGRTLALAASQARSTDELAFWAGGAQSTVLVERALHESRVGDLSRVAPSPVCTAYTSYLQGLSTRGSYPVLIAGVLPCYWVYDDVGTRLKARLGARLEGHPYADWIATYGDPAFAQACLRAREVVDAAAEASSPEVVTAMHEAFATATRYEWMFWDAPMRQDGWPV